MSAKAALVLGVFLVAAAVLHGGVYTAGHDFVVNRFTGTYAFVPADDADEEVRTPVRIAAHCLQHSKAAATTVALRSRR